MKWGKFSCFLFYPLTKCALFLKEGNWMLKCHVVILGNYGLAFLWKEKSPKVR